MNESLAWAIVALIGALLGLGTALGAYYIRLRTKLKVREMLYRERLAAIAKGINNPVYESSQPGLANSTGNRLANVPAIKMLSLCGVVLFFGGIGLAMGFYNSEYAMLAKVASLSFIPLAVGLGLIIYTLFLELLSRAAKKIRDIF
jgi:hypothetical protein